MGELVKIVDLTTAQFAALAALFLPGFVSLKVYRLLRPGAGKPPGAAEMVLEAFGYSLINGALLLAPILISSSELASGRPNYLLLSAAAILIFILGPLCWPILVLRSLEFATRRGWLSRPKLFAWDAFFGRNEPCWLIIHLPGGETVGGYFGTNSYATEAPESGHLYVEQLWRLSEAGEFIEAVPESKGALFRPSDYTWIEIFEDD